MNSPFSSPVGKYRESYCCHFNVGVGISIPLNNFASIFYVMGTALSGKLSCMRAGVVQWVFSCLASSFHTIAQLVKLATKTYDVTVAEMLVITGHYICSC